MNIFKVDELGKCRYNSPLRAKKNIKFISSGDSIIYKLKKAEIKHGAHQYIELAGPRDKIFFNPGRVKCGIVTCGGLCPGINDIIRGLVIELNYNYGINTIFGYRYGYRGLVDIKQNAPIKLTPELVDPIHRDGGTMLGSSRGPQDIGKMINTLDNMGVNILFAVGGDGTMKGARDIANLIKKKRKKISVIAIPKTIDNDINYISRSFGFETAVQASADIVESAHIEAKGAPNCIGLVKLMGRTSGFIASYTALANRNVNYCLIPEVPFRLTGKTGLIEVLKKRLKNKGHAVIVLAEGAGQDIIADNKKQKKDVSGNVKLEDIGMFMKSEIKKQLEKDNIEVNIKYFDPSYIIRSIPANAMDSLYCVQLAQHAVHAGMAGKTNMLISHLNSHYVNVPIKQAVKQRKSVNPDGRLWRSVLDATMQPHSMLRI